MSASRRLRFLGLGLFLVALAYSPLPGAQAQAEPADLWADFNHYVLIARPDLAQAAGTALLEQVEPQQLLQIAEASDYADYHPNLDRAGRMDGLTELAEELRRALERGQVEQSRDPQRIAENIAMLREGRRPFQNATHRLRAAGQFAAPQMLAALEDGDREREHPYIVNAMVSVGRPLVEPLAVALPQLEPVPQRHVAQVLAQIGYPEALPAVREVLESEEIGERTGRVVQRAYETLVERARLEGRWSAAELYLHLGESAYRAGTLGDRLPSFDVAEDRGVVWGYRPRHGLEPVFVPGAIHADVIAMRAAERALGREAEMAPALSLYLAANLRRANRLPEGERDPSYAAAMRSPAYYAMLAGPARLHDVLERALGDGDAALALDAIAALRDTAGTDALVRRDAGRRPLLEALSYPDRRVRFHAAEALANARPGETFAGAHRVVPVLADAVRQGETRHALVLADSRDHVHQLLGLLDELGYDAFGGTSLDEVAGEVDARPGVDVIVTRRPVEGVARLMHDTADDYKLAATPVLAIVSPGGQVRLEERFGETRRFRSVVADNGESAVREAVRQLADDFAGERIGADEAHAMSLTALRVLREIALVAGVYNVHEAEPALTRALADEREGVAEAAGEALALIDSSSAQRALADRALALEAGELKVALLNSLAASATRHGNMLSFDHGEALLELVRTSEGELADAAARAHGALSLPTGHAVELILNPGE